LAGGTMTGALNFAPEIDLASAGTTDIGAQTSNNVRITGTTTITSFGTAANGVTRELRFAGALTLTYNATSLILPGGANITTAAGDTATAKSLGSGNWVVTDYQRAAVVPLAATPPITPTNTGGPGNFIALYTPSGTTLFLPAGGTWAYNTRGITAATGVLAGLFSGGVAAGGSVVGGLNAGIYWEGFAWRIA
jgi:hypothetical protein